MPPAEALEPPAPVELTPEPVELPTPVAAPPPVAALAETLLPSKWLGQKVEAQACTPDVCDFVCGECEWEPCKVVADDGSKCDVKFADDDQVCFGVLHRFLRVTCGGRRKRKHND